MILRNHGLPTVGPTIADVFLAMYALETACQIQLLAQSTGSKLNEVPGPVVEGITARAEEVTKGPVVASPGHACYESWTGAIRPTATDQPRKATIYSPTA